MMAATIRIERAGPLTTIQDAGRFGLLSHGISASGPMDAASFAKAGRWAGNATGAGVEFSVLGLDVTVIDRNVSTGWHGGNFTVAVNGALQEWPGSVLLREGDRLTISAATSGNYGYLRFGSDIDIPMVLGSKSTSLRARLGGLDGRTLRPGNVLQLVGEATSLAAAMRETEAVGPIRFIWGLHADLFDGQIREQFVTSAFRVSSMMDRMGVRLHDDARVFADAKILSLVSDPVVAGDIQILGDGTPIVLGRDHQPTGGYPRIGTIISADLDRFFQLRPNAEVRFVPLGLDRAQALLRSGTR